MRGCHATLGWASGPARHVSLTGTWMAALTRGSAALCDGPWIVRCDADSARSRAIIIQSAATGDSGPRCHVVDDVEIVRDVEAGWRRLVALRTLVRIGCRYWSDVTTDAEFGMEGRMRRRLNRDVLEAGQWRNGRAETLIRNIGSTADAERAWRVDEASTRPRCARGRTVANWSR